MSIPQVSLGTETLVFDVDANETVMTIAGNLVLPVGARIQLPKGDGDGPASDAVVTAVTLITGAPTDAPGGKKYPVTVRLSVRREPAAP